MKDKQEVVMEPEITAIEVLIAEVEAELRAIREGLAGLEARLNKILEDAEAKP